MKTEIRCEYSRRHCKGLYECRFQERCEQQISFGNKFYCRFELANKREVEKNEDSNLCLQ
jgi:hypothetical protein